MRFLTHNENGKIDAMGTSCMGVTVIDYATLIEKFGDHMGGDGDKIDAEWDIEWADGMVSTIYNYKTGKTYLGKDGAPVEDIEEWHIGGEKIESLYRILNVLHGQYVSKVLPSINLSYEPDHRTFIENMIQPDSLKALDKRCQGEVFWIARLRHEQNCDKLIEEHDRGVRWIVIGQELIEGINNHEYMEVSSSDFEGNGEVVAYDPETHSVSELLNWTSESKAEVLDLASVLELAKWHSELNLIKG